METVCTSTWACTQTSKMQMSDSLWLLPLSLWSQHCSGGCPHSQMRLKYRHANAPLNNSQNKDSTTKKTPPRNNNKKPTTQQPHMNIIILMKKTAYLAAVSQDKCLFIINESHLTLMHCHSPSSSHLTHSTFIHRHQKSFVTNAPSFNIIKSHLTLMHLHSLSSKVTWH